MASLMNWSICLALGRTSSIARWVGLKVIMSWKNVASRVASAFRSLPSRCCASVNRAMTCLDCCGPLSSQTRPGAGEVPRLRDHEPLELQVLVPRQNVEEGLGQGLQAGCNAFAGQGDHLEPGWPPKFPQVWPPQIPPPELIGSGE